MTAHTTTAHDADALVATERAAFEVWRVRNTQFRNPSDAVALDGFGDDAGYFNSTTRAMWSAWQARARLAQPAPDAQSAQEAMGALIEALRFYADPGHYKAPYTGGLGKLYFDCGQTAKAAIDKALASKGTP